jgi:hypothetical protein
MCTVVSVPKPSLEGPPDKVGPNHSRTRRIRDISSPVGINLEDTSTGPEKRIKIRKSSIEVRDGMEDIQSSNHIVVA